MTLQQIEELERLEKKATPGQWELLWVDYCGTIRIETKDDDPGASHYDKELILTMRNALPELLELATDGLRWRDLAL